MTEKYIDLTSPETDLSKISIVKRDNYNCDIVDKNGEVYNGFILAKSKSGKMFTICNFQKSFTDDKYQPRLTFKKTDSEFKERNVNKGADAVRITFDKGQDGYREFWKMISFLFQWRETINLNEFEEFFSVTDKNLAAALSTIAKMENKEEVLKTLEKMSNEELSNIENLIIGTKITSIIEEWEKNKNIDIEEYWQELFKKNPWILSQIFACPYIKIGEKTYCGGKGDDNSGGVLGDLLYKNSLTGGLAFIEIKTPKKDIIGKKYRGEQGKENCIYGISNELTGGVNQVLNQKKVYIKTHGEKGQKTLNRIKCVLIIGKLPEDQDMKKSFELYRSSLNSVEIVTFDELFERIDSLQKLFL